MAENTEKSKLQYIVADSAAFLKNVPLHDMCENVYTVEEVVNEVRDAATRRRLSVLPYTLHFRQPSSEALHVVTEFAKLTGDFKSLSAVDLRVLALTYQLEKEHYGTEHLRTAPSKQVDICQDLSGKAVPGFFVEKGLEKNRKENEPEEKEMEWSVTDKTADKELTVSNKAGITGGKAEDTDVDSDMNNQLVGTLFTTLCELSSHNSKDNDGLFVVGEKETYNDCISKCDDGWITPANIHHVKNEMGKDAVGAVPAASVSVGCLTTDFAMQNVLIQMGIHVISLDGMLIREARSYVMKCHACFKVTSQLTRMFCPWCGNNTLLKVSVSVDENGVTRYQMPKSNRPFNIRGKKFPLPLPKGGRRGDNPVLTEDQPLSQHRLPRNKDCFNVFDTDYIARASPFAAKDVTSRASQLGYHLKSSQRNKNPNEVRKKSSQRKK